MKKLSLLFAILAVTFISGSAIVRAQSTDTLDDSDSSETTSLDADTDTDTSTAAADTETESATVPDTGFAPAGNKVFTSSMVFVGGAALGGAVGFGVIQLRKKSQN